MSCGISRKIADSWIHAERKMAATEPKENNLDNVSIDDILGSAFTTPRGACHHSAHVRCLIATLRCRTNSNLYTTRKHISSRTRCCKISAIGQVLRDRAADFVLLFFLGKKTNTAARSHITHIPPESIFQAALDAAKSMGIGQGLRTWGHIM